MQAVRRLGRKLHEHLAGGKNARARAGGQAQLVTHRCALVCMKEQLIANWVRGLSLSHTHTASVCRAQLACFCTSFDE